MIITDVWRCQYTTQLSIDATPQLVQPHAGDPNNLVNGTLEHRPMVLLLTTPTLMPRSPSRSSSSSNKKIPERSIPIDGFLMLWEDKSNLRSACCWMQVPSQATRRSTIVCSHLSAASSLCSPWHLKLRRADDRILRCSLGSLLREFDDMSLWA